MVHKTAERLIASDGLLELFQWGQLNDVLRKLIPVCHGARKRAVFAEIWWCAYSHVKRIRDVQVTSGLPLFMMYNLEEGPHIWWWRESWEVGLIVVAVLARRFLKSSELSDLILSRDTVVFCRSSLWPCEEAYFKGIVFLSRLRCHAFNLILSVWIPYWAIPKNAPSPYDFQTFDFKTLFDINLCFHSDFQPEKVLISTEHQNENLSSVWIYFPRKTLK